MKSILFFITFLLAAFSSADCKLNPVSATSKLLDTRGGSIGRGGDDLDWRYFVAGGVCAACSHGITTPIGNDKSLGKIYSFNL